MNKRSTELDTDLCICGHYEDGHTCVRSNCPRLGLHTEECRYPECDCADFLPLVDRYPSAKNVRIDLDRHESVDMSVRATDMSDIRAAYTDRYGKKWFDDRPRWRSR